MNDPSFPSSRKGGEGPRIAAPTSNSAKKQRNLRSRGEPIETTPSKAKEGVMTPSSSHHKRGALVNFKMSHLPGARAPRVASGVQTPQDFLQVPSGSQTARGAAPTLASKHRAQNLQTQQSHGRLATLTESRPASTDQFLMNSMHASGSQKDKAPSAGPESSACPLSMKTIALPERRHGTLAPKSTRPDLGVGKGVAGSNAADEVPAEGRSSINGPKTNTKQQRPHSGQGLPKNPSMREMKPGLGLGGATSKHYKYPGSGTASGAQTARNKEREEIPKERGPRQAAAQVRAAAGGRPVPEKMEIEQTASGSNIRGGVYTATARRER